MEKNIPCQPLSFPQMGTLRTEFSKVYIYFIATIFLVFLTASVICTTLVPRVLF